MTSSTTGYRTLLAAAAFGTALMIATSAQATTTNDYSLATGSPFSGNDCAGTLGTPPNCAWNGSLMIAKFDFNDNGTITFTQGSFPTTITGSEFSFDITFAAGEWANSGKWTYTPGSDDPGITAFSVKGGPNYNVYDKGGPAFLGVGDFSDTWSAPGTAGVSHIVFFDTLQVVPVPAALPLFLTALAGLGVIGYRRSKAA